MQVRLVKALERMSKTSGRAAVLPVAVTVSSFDQARFLVEAMEMLADFHEKTAAIKSVHKDMPLAGSTASGALVVAGPADRLAWTERLHRFATRPDLKTGERIIRLRGQATPRAKSELTRLGWSVREDSTK
jgi:hypothetical protein